MVIGRVYNGRVQCTLAFLSADGANVYPITFMIDTGYSGPLLIPRTLLGNISNVRIGRTEEPAVTITGDRLVMDGHLATIVLRDDDELVSAGTARGRRCVETVIHVPRQPARVATALMGMDFLRPTAIHFVGLHAEIDP